jgi:hypothetical protein
VGAHTHHANPVVGMETLCIRNYYLKPSLMTQPKIQSYTMAAKHFGKNHTYYDRCISAVNGTSLWHMPDSWKYSSVNYALIFVFFCVTSRVT